MERDRIWRSLGDRPIGRRALLRSAARCGVGVAGLALVGGGGDDDEAEALSDPEGGTESDVATQSSRTAPTSAPSSVVELQSDDGVATLRIPEGALPAGTDPESVVVSSVSQEGVPAVFSRRGGGRGARGDRA